MRKFKNVIITNLLVVYKAQKDKFYFPVLFGRIFNKSSLNKVIIIFIVGFISRILVNYVYDTNVYLDYLNIISFIYYVYMACFVVLIHELIIYFDFNVIPSITNIIDVIKKVFISLSTFNSTLFSSALLERCKSLKVEYFKLSFFRKVIKELISKIKVPFYLNGAESDIFTSKNIKNNSAKNPLISNIVNKGIDNGKDLLPKTTYKPNENIGESNNANTSGNRNYDNNRQLPRRTNRGDDVRVMEASNSSSSNRPTSIKTEFGYSANTSFGVNNQTDNGLCFRVDSIQEGVRAKPLFTPNIPQTNNFTSNYNPDANLMPDPLFARNRPYVSSSVYSQSQGLESQDTIKPATPKPVYDIPSLVNAKLAGQVEPPIGQHPGMYRASVPVVPSQDSLASHISINTNKATSVVTNPNASFADADVLSLYRNQILSRNDEGVRVSQDSPIVSSQEIVVKKRGLLGKFKLGFNYFGDKFTSSTSKVESVYVKYHDISKRKFFWTIWEKRHGNYESYEDFKRSWDPNTNIWKEIRERTKTDMSTDVEGILGINTSRRGIQPSERREINRAVSNLLHDNRPFARPVDGDNNAGQEVNAGHNTSRGHSHRHGHRHGHDGHRHVRNHRNNSN